MTDPGTVMFCWGDFGAYAVVLATSRHKRTCNEETARDLLRRQYHSEGRRIRRFSRQTWRSHTKRYMELFGCECDGDGWCYDGDGAAWIEVLVAELQPDTTGVA